MISGTLKNGNVITPISGKLNGDEISFTAGGAQYTGWVNGKTIEGTVKGGSNGKCTATSG